MTITLLAVSLNEQPLTQPIKASFDASGGTIGRADHNTMALPDPERHISRLQAEIIGSGTQFVIKNVGAANPIIIGNRTLAQGESMPLADRDQIRIGGYLLQAVLDAGDDYRGADITRGRAAITAGERPELRSHAWVRDPAHASVPPRTGAPGTGGGLADIATPLSSDNPFADLIGNPAPPAFAAPVAASHGMPRHAPAAAVPYPAPPAPARVAPAPSAFATPVAPPVIPAQATAFAKPSPGRPPGDTFADLMPAPAGISRESQGLGGNLDAWGQPPANAGQRWDAPAPPHRLPDDFDPFAPPPPRQPSPTPVPSRAGAFDDLIPSAPPSSLDDIYGLRPGTGGDPLANFMAGVPATPRDAASGGANPAAPAGGLSVDPLALFGGSDRPAPARAPSAEDHTPDLLAGFVPPNVVQRHSEPAPLAGFHEPHVESDATRQFGRPAQPGPRAPVPATFAPVVQARAPAPSVPDTANPVLPTRFDWQVSSTAARGGVPTSVAQAAKAHAQLSATVAPRSAAAPLDFELASTGARPRSTPVPPTVAPQQAMGASQRAGGTEAAALWRAFCEGAGIEPGSSALTPEVMREIGGVLRAAVDGTLQLMSVRATTKHELRAAVTMIQARGNNPLKFSPDAATGIEQLLRPTMRGFLSGPSAMSDAMNDLVGHSIGTVAGMRAALDGMLGRFAPSQLEAKLVGSSLLDSVLPMNRKAKLWELYLQHFESIREEAQEDFHTLFGKAFLAAYEQQLDRLKRDGNPGGQGPSGPSGYSG